MSTYWQSTRNKRRDFHIFTDLVRPLPSFAVTITPVFAQDTPYSEEYMRQHDGGDRAEYLQEMESSDPFFYVPPADSQLKESFLSSNLLTICVPIQEECDSL